jgi:hypothetical protein
MRAAISLELVISAATLLAACTPTGPGPDGGGDSVRLTVAPSSATIDGGSTFRLTAKVTGQDGEVITPADVSWSSSDATVADVGSAGLVEGRQPGEALIFASWGNARGSALVTVVRGPKETPDDPPCPAVLHEAGTNRILTPDC